MTIQQTQTFQSPPRRVLGPFLAFFAVITAVGCTGSSALELSNGYLREGHIYLAFSELDREYQTQIEAGVLDEDLAAAREALYPRYLIARARREVYADRELEALALLEEGLALVPGNEAALELVQRANRKLADRATKAAQDYLIRKEITEALALFMQAQDYVPGYPPATQGVEALRQAVKEMHREAQEQYLEAIRKMPQFRFEEVDWHTRVAIDRNDSRADAVEVRDRALVELAERAVKSAIENRDTGHFGAALMEYRSALAIWESIAGAADESRLDVIHEYIAHMEREVKAQSMIERALLAVEADRVDDARGMLAEAVLLTSLQQAEINELRHEARVREGERAYDHARDLELQGMKSAALAAFEQLSAQWPDGLRDEKTRVGALREDISGASTEYAQGIEAERKGELAVALDHFQMAATFYERFPGVLDSIERVQEKIAAEAGNGASGAEAIR